jgi:hypothetical protein
VVEWESASRRFECERATRRQSHQARRLSRCINERRDVVHFARLGILPRITLPATAAILGEDGEVLRKERGELRRRPNAGWAMRRPSAAGLVVLLGK